MSIDLAVCRNFTRLVGGNCNPFIELEINTTGHAETWDFPSRFSRKCAAVDLLPLTFKNSRTLLVDWVHYHDLGFFDGWIKYRELNWSMLELLQAG